MASRRLAIFGLSAAGRPAATRGAIQPMRRFSSASPSPRPPPQASDRGPLNWRAVAICLGVGTGVLGYYAIEKQRRMHEITAQKTIGKAAIGGPFSLLDAKNKEFTENDILGRWTLIYFGFTMCPDICPDELTKVSEALNTLTRRGKKVGPTAEADLTPILISVDPERDSPARTHEYAQGFHASFLGLSGSIDNVKAAAKAYRVYYSKDETPGDEYLVDHSIITYLMTPEGEFADFYAKNATATEIAARIEATMLSWRPTPGSED